jgi:selenocysteine lyase/cysteine desulfurase
MSHSERRDFLLQAAAAGTALLAHSPLSSASVRSAAGGLGSGTEAQGLWGRVRAGYSFSHQLLNLNNAGVSPQPRVVQDALIRAYRFANELPDVNMWEVLDATRLRTKQKLAALADCAPEEIALNRNATEGLCTVIYGLSLSPGDEVVISDWDYQSLRHAWQQRATREGIVLRSVDFPVNADDDTIIAAYRGAITARTKVLYLTHVVHYTGAVTPVAALCAIARAAGIQTIVDAAQSFAQYPVSFRSIGCDYLAVSLHKWLCAPFGTGMLIVRKERIEPLWPLLAPFDDPARGIARLDGSALGTYCSPAEHAIEPAIDFHHQIGSEAIHRRLHELSRYWIEAVRDIPGFELHTPLTDTSPTAVATFSLKQLPADDLEAVLRSRHAIHVLARHRGSFSGVRVSPHVYTQQAELDRFVRALHAVAVAA